MIPVEKSRTLSGVPWYEEYTIAEPRRDLPGEPPVEDEWETRVIRQPQGFKFLPNADHSIAESGRLIQQVSSGLVPEYFREQRHIEVIEALQERIDPEVWARITGKERMKTVTVALVLCLHLGVDPPDAIPRPKVRAKLESWYDPAAATPMRSAKKIALELQQNYAKWQPRAKYKVALDPTADELKKMCQNLRRTARDERILFHYNGHGVPRPTSSGEIWVFNKNYTQSFQYIPVSIFNLQTWLEHPCIYVWDCNYAGSIVENYSQAMETHEGEWFAAFEKWKEKRSYETGSMEKERIGPSTNYMDQAKKMGFQRTPPFGIYRECIHLAACQADERLPTDARLPADMFTSCLTTPLQTSILWYMIRKDILDQFPEDVIHRIPGQLTDRRTLLGELNWVFTAITDTIAWNCLPRDTFQRLYRQDQMLASLMRSYLLAEKLMPTFGCHPICIPAMPRMDEHPLWTTWEAVMDNAVAQLVDVFFCEADTRKTTIALHDKVDVFAPTAFPKHDVLNRVSLMEEIPDGQPHWFFSEQMTAFENWVSICWNRSVPPAQLPVVLQVLLSQAHRTRALEGLSRFLDLGVWAINHVLSVGIFPYILKLLQSSQKDLRLWLSFIWAKILTVEPSACSEFFKEIIEENVNATNQKDRITRSYRFIYFLTVLNDTGLSPRQRIIPAYVNAMLLHGTQHNHQRLMREKNYVATCVDVLDDPATWSCALLKIWAIVGIGRLWVDYNDGRWHGIREHAQRSIAEHLKHPCAEVRAASVWALGCLIKNHSHSNEHASVIDEEAADAIVENCLFDGSILVREEALIALQFFVLDFLQVVCKYFLNLLYKIGLDVEIELDMVTSDGSGSETQQSASPNLSTTKTSSSFAGLSRTSQSLSSNSTLAPQPSELAAHILTRDEINNSAHGPAALSQNEQKFRSRTLGQIRNLERRTFRDPVERIWLGLLRFTLDPNQNIGDMARLLVRHVELHAAALHVNVEKRLIASASIHEFSVSGSSSGSRTHRNKSNFSVSSSSQHSVDFRVNTTSSRDSMSPPQSTVELIEYEIPKFAHSVDDSASSDEFTESCEDTDQDRSTSTDPVVLPEHSTAQNVPCEESDKEADTMVDEGDENTPIIRQPSPDRENGCEKDTGLVHSAEERENCGFDKSTDEVDCARRAAVGVIGADHIGQGDTVVNQKSDLDKSGEEAEFGDTETDQDTVSGPRPESLQDTVTLSAGDLLKYAAGDCTYVVPEGDAKTPVQSVPPLLGAFTKKENDDDTKESKDQHADNVDDLTPKRARLRRTHSMKEIADIEPDRRPSLQEYIDARRRREEEIRMRQRKRAASWGHAAPRVAPRRREPYTIALPPKVKKKNPVDVDVTPDDASPIRVIAKEPFVANDKAMAFCSRLYVGYKLPEEMNVSPISIEQHQLEKLFTDPDMYQILLEIFRCQEVQVLLSPHNVLLQLLQFLDRAPNPPPILIQHILDSLVKEQKELHNANSSPEKQWEIMTRWRNISKKLRSELKINPATNLCHDAAERIFVKIKKAQRKYLDHIENEHRILLNAQHKRISDIASAEYERDIASKAAETRKLEELEAFKGETSNRVDASDQHVRENEPNKAARLRELEDTLDAIEIYLFTLYDAVPLHKAVPGDFLDTDEFAMRKFTLRMRYLDIVKMLKLLPAREEAAQRLIDFFDKLENAPAPTMLTPELLERQNDIINEVLHAVDDATRAKLEHVLLLTNPKTEASHTQDVFHVVPCEGNAERSIQKPAERVVTRPPVKLAANPKAQVSNTEGFFPFPIVSEKAKTERALRKRVVPAEKVGAKPKAEGSNTEGFFPFPVVPDKAKTERALRKRVEPAEKVGAKPKAEGSNTEGFFPFPVVPDQAKTERALRKRVEPAEKVGAKPKAEGSNTEGFFPFPVVPDQAKTERALRKRVEPTEKVGSKPKAEVPNTEGFFPFPVVPDKANTERKLQKEVETTERIAPRPPVKFAVGSPAVASLDTSLVQGGEVDTQEKLAIIEESTRKSAALSKSSTGLPVSWDEMGPIMQQIKSVVRPPPIVREDSYDEALELKRRAEMFPKPSITFSQNFSVTEAHTSSESNSSERKWRIRDFDKNSTLAQFHHFKAKRTVAGRTGGSEFKAPNPHPHENEKFPILTHMINSEFIPWCSKQFANPCMHLSSFEEGRDGFGDNMTVWRNPNNWSLFSATEQRKESDQLISDLKQGFCLVGKVPDHVPETRRPKVKTQKVEFNAQIMATRTEKVVYAASFSPLRPYIYSTDGEYVSAHRYDDKCRLVRRVHNFNGNNHCVDRACWIQGINGSSHEMCLVGSRNGLVRLWDLNVDECGTEMLGPMVMKNAFHSLGDRQRFPFDYAECTREMAVYDWDEYSGRLLSGGPMKGIRVWDAHSERTLIDQKFDYGRNNSHATAVAGDFSESHLYSAGFPDGMLRVYDDRLPTQEALVMILEELKGFPIKGMDIFTYNGRTALAAASSDGRIVVYEPRMYQEPILFTQSRQGTELPPKEMLTSFALHPTTQLMADVVPSPAPQLNVYDSTGKSLAHINMNDVAGRPLQQPTFIAFHPVKPIVAIGTVDRYLSAYGVNY